MSWLGSAIAGTLGGVAGLIQTGLNFQQAQKQEWYNQRDFDYQRAVQDETWRREDNAVQRRMVDLKAAGLNPNLAAGSAASAGAIVGRSSTSAPSVNIGNPVGTALDMASAVVQLRNQKEQNQILKNQKRESAANATLAENESVLNNAELFNLLGIKSDIRFNHKSGEMSVIPRFSFPKWSSYTDTSGNKGFERSLSSDNSPFMQYLKWQYLNNKNSADLLQKDVDWYTADKIANYAGTVGNFWSSAGSGYRSFTFGRRR